MKWVDDLFLIRLHRICNRLPIALGRGKTAHCIAWSVKNLLWNYHIVGNLEGYETVFSAAVVGFILLTVLVVAGFLSRAEKDSVGAKPVIMWTKKRIKHDLIWLI